MNKLLILVSLSLLIISCGSKDKNEQKRKEPTQNNLVTLTQEQYKNAAIETGKMSKKNISSLLKVNGKIDVPPNGKVSISVPMGGYLKFTKLIVGMQINKGDILAEMEDVQYIQLQQDYLTAKAQHTTIENEYIRQKELNKSKASSDKVFEQANTAYQTQLVLIKALEQKLLLLGLNPEKISNQNISKSIKIFSPISGFISVVNVNIGKYVTPSEVMFELVAPNNILLSLSIFEKDINKLSIGQKLFAYTNINTNKKYNCEIILISPNLTNQNSAEVICRFEKYHNNLLPGMFMNAEIELLGNNVNTLPSDAIVRFNNKQYVFIDKNNNEFEMHEVQIGNTENGYTEIVNANNLINLNFVIKGAYNLLMAMKNKNQE